MDPSQPSESYREPIVTSHVVSLPPAYPPPPPPRRRSRLLSTVGIGLVLLVLGGSLLLNLVFVVVGSMGADSDRRVRQRHFSHKAQAPDKVAIITIEGLIHEGEGGFVKRQIDQVRHDQSVKAVVLRVNSPGGTVTGSDYLYHHLGQLVSERRIPMVVSMGGIAASGGYYVSMAVGPRPETIFAEPATWTGSIGVIIPHYNAEELMTKVGIQQDSVVSHPLKGMGSVTRGMTGEERDIFQALVNESFGNFKEIVKRGRPRFKDNAAALDKLATGQVFTADQAVKNGLVDKIGFLEDAVDQAIKLAGLSPEDVSVVDYKPEFSFVQLLLGSQSRQPQFDPTAVLLEMSVPRAYYLCTLLPPLFTGGK